MGTILLGSSQHTKVQASPQFAKIPPTQPPPHTHTHQKFIMRIYNSSPSKQPLSVEDEKIKFGLTILIYHFLELLSVWPMG